MERDTQDLLGRLKEAFTHKGLTVSTAESCTGGLLSHYLTCLPGASGWFAGGCVAYTAEAKQKLLGVKGETIQRHGLISEQCAMEMAENIRGLTGSHYSLATTGNLGPSALEGKELGLVYIALAREGETVTKRLKLLFGRAENRELAAREALRFLLGLMDTGVIKT